MIKIVGQEYGKLLMTPPPTFDRKKPGKQLATRSRELLVSKPFCKLQHLCIHSSGRSPFPPSLSISNSPLQHGTPTNYTWYIFNLSYPSIFKPFPVGPMLTSPCPTPPSPGGPCRSSASQGLEAQGAAGWAAQGQADALEAPRGGGDGWSSTGGEAFH